MANTVIRSVVSSTNRNRCTSDCILHIDEPTPTFSGSKTCTCKCQRCQRSHPSASTTTTYVIKSPKNYPTGQSTSTTRPPQSSTTPVREHRHRTSNLAALGPLSALESPIFGNNSQQSQQSLSLRASAPQYLPAARNDNNRSSSRRTNSLHSRRHNKHVDRTAVEATDANMDMNFNNDNGCITNGTIMTAANEKREHLYKILVIGELGTGKTSFIKRYVHQFFSQNYRATIGVDFALKVLHWDSSTIVRLQLWDIAGQERFGNMTRVYYKEAVGAFIVFDVTRSGTFDCVSKWKEDLDSKVQLSDGSPIPCILLANKCDQDKQGIVTTPEKMDDYVRENGFAGWFETSAKENINIDEAARALVNKILLNDKLISAADLSDSGRFILDNTEDPNATDTKNKCAC